MRILFFTAKSASLAVIVVTALFFSVAIFGFRQGTASALVKNVYATARELNTGLDNFFSDQGRFPAVSEFSDANILLMYFSRLPDNVSKTALCPENFIYKRLSPGSYELDFCLAANLRNFQKGWNKVIVSR